MTTTIPRSPATLLLLVAAALATLLLAASPAAAHAELTGSTPGDGEVVATAPDQVSLTFSESVSLADDAVRVLDPRGERADTGQLVDEGGNTHSLTLRPDLADGTYTVAWQAVSADSHPVAGAFTFSIGAPSETTVEVSTDTGDQGAVGLLYDIARYASYTGFLLLAGSAAFALRCWPDATGRRAVQRVTLTGWTTLTAATIALLLLRTPYTGSGELADALDLDGLGDVIDTRIGTALVTRLLLLAAAGLFIAVLFGPYARLRATPEGDPGADLDEDTASRVKDLAFGLALGGTILAIGTAATWSMSEHAATGRQTGLAIPADILHLLAVAAWLGGLTTLLVLLRTEPALPREAVRRFSAVALTSVTVLAATGLYQSWRQVGLSWSALTGTDYGRLLLLKVALVATLLLAARISRRWTGLLTDDPEPAKETETAEDPAPEPLTDDPERARQLARQRTAVAEARRRQARDADPRRSGLRRSVLTETAIAAVLLAVTTALTATTPARTADSETPAAATEDTAGPEISGNAQGTLSIPFDTGGEWGQGTAEVDVTPARTGSNTVQIRLFDTEGLPTGAVEIRVAFTLPAEELGPLRHEPLHVGVGHWTVTDVQLPRPGEWEMALTIRTSDIDQVTETTTLRVE
ncbi:copper resistance CopC/CopD family protein [Streptomyces litchfieldiae]|uniref:Copper resistance protein CopC n=1 Tax=Streptomyces litchfieldiae TaxID=3075543 RepID=A0ABU2MKQ5_9ACTN|nr:copper resistance protein CopC [Streptomyces sp. DSM 44938]MDT0342061.1 copper resistance protein CopC [Streptomyces sp. DSM 44938]